MLEIKNLHASYATLPILKNVSFTAQRGQITCLLGRNGAGKTTTLKTIMGLLPAVKGDVLWDKTKLSDLPCEQVPRHGIAYIPQGRGLFSELSVSENLDIGLMARGHNKATREHVLELFPLLRKRLQQRADTLSGGEQQMLATARALCLKPEVILLDEPTEGLQPSMRDLIHKVILQMRDQNMCVILVEQNVQTIMALADKAVFLENGEKIDEMAQTDLRKNSNQLSIYLGV